MEEQKYYDPEIETMPRPDLEKLQLKSLKKILKFAYQNSPYYHQTFDQLGLKVDKFDTLKDLEKLPFCSKQTERETLDKNSLMDRMCAVPEKDVVFMSMSSGSTGVQTFSPFTQQDFTEWQEVESRLFYCAGMRATDRYLHALNFSMFTGGPIVLGAQKLGALCFWGGIMPSERLLYIMQTVRPTIIYTTPSYAWQLGEKARKLNLNPKDFNLKKIIVTGELGGGVASTRRAIEKTWGAAVYDFYGFTDIWGSIAAQCEYQTGMHLAEDHLLVEVIDPETEQVLPDGAVGELVFTSLRKQARPMIRFKTGDIGYVDKSPCPCGRTHARIYLKGRKDDMMVVSGVNVWPSDIESVVREFPGITGEYLIRIFEQDYTNKFILEVEKCADNQASIIDIADKLSRAIKAHIGVKPAQVIVHPDGSLNTRAEHKSKRIIDERKQNLVK